jgi:hypothetical protein
MALAMAVRSYEATQNFYWKHCCWSGTARPAQFFERQQILRFKSFWGKHFFPAKDLLSFDSTGREVGPQMLHAGRPKPPWMSLAVMKRHTIATISVSRRKNANVSFTSRNNYATATAIRRNVEGP